MGFTVDEKSSEQVIGDPDRLERYLDDFLRDSGQTFDGWVERFGQGFYTARNQAILDLLRPLNPKRIFEFACAGGFLAKLLLDEIPGIERYECSNFSRRMVEYCSRQLSNYPHCDTSFVNADLGCSADMRHKRLGEYDVFLTTSFEHIEHDIELIKALPPGRIFLFGVAGFDDPEHYRYFTSDKEVRDRYAEHLSILHVEKLPRRKFVVLARTRGEAPG